jgi:hypothetical protein
MATPYVPERGHTEIVLGQTYSRFPVNSVLCEHNQYVLKTYNHATGLCKMQSVMVDLNEQIFK